MIRQDGTVDSASFVQDACAGRPAAARLGAHGLRFVPGSDALVVAFLPAPGDDAAREGGDAASTALGEAFLRERGLGMLAVSAQGSDWYRAPDLHRTLRDLAEAGFFRRFRRVLFHGASMGGFGALAFAELAPGCTVLAHGPQSTMDPAVATWETRFGGARRQRWDGDFRDGAIGVRDAARIYVTFDPFCAPDRRHVDRLPHANLVPLRMPMLGHALPAWLMQMKLFAPIFDGALDGSLTAARFHAMAKARFALPHYLLSLAARCHGAARKGYLAEKARGLAPQLEAPRALLAGLPRPARPAGAIRWVVWALDGCGGDELHARLERVQPDARHLRFPFQGGTGRPHDLTALHRSLPHQNMVRDEVRRLLDGAATVVHRVDAEGGRFDRLLVEETRGAGFAHLLLYRRDLFAQARAGRVARQMAAIPGGTIERLIAEGPARTLNDDIAALVVVEGLLRLAGAAPHRLAIEDLRQGGSVLASAAPPLAALLSPHSSGSEVVVDAEPLEADGAWRFLRREVDWIPGFPAGRALLAPRSQDEVAPRCVRFDPLPPLLAACAALNLSGLAVAPAETAHAGLLLRQRKAEQDARWGQPSPAGPREFPGHSGAGSARFGHVRIVADEGAPVELIAFGPSPAERTRLATLRFEAHAGRRRIEGLYLAPWRIGFRPLPGAASTAIGVALKQWLDTTPEYIEDRHPDEWRAFFEGRRADISGADYRFAVVREPLERFVSLYRRYVEGKATARGIDDLEGFVDGFDRWCTKAEAAPLFRSQTALLGDPRAFHRLCRLADPGPLQRDLEQRTGRSLQLSSGSRFKLFGRLGLGVPRRVRQWVAERYRDDFSLYEGL